MCLRIRERSQKELHAEEGMGDPYVILQNLAVCSVNNCFFQTAEGIANTDANSSKYRLDITTYLMYHFTLMKS